VNLAFQLVLSDLERAGVRVRFIRAWRWPGFRLPVATYGLTANGTWRGHWDGRAGTLDGAPVGAADLYSWKMHCLGRLLEEARVRRRFGDYEL
jgi:hypothetical protein